MFKRIKKLLFLRKLNKQIAQFNAKATIVNKGDRAVDTLEIHMENDFCHIGLPEQNYHQGMIEFVKEHIKNKKK